MRTCDVFKMMQKRSGDVEYHTFKINKEDLWVFEHMKDIWDIDPQDYDE